MNPNSTLQCFEQNDCVVRAIACAAEVDYVEAYKFVAEKLDRKPKQGVFGFENKMLKLINQGTILGKQFDAIGERAFGQHSQKRLYTYYGKEKEIRRMMTFKSFAKLHPVGCYLIAVQNHVFVLKNGVVVGNKEDATQLRKRVHFVFQVK